MWVGSTAMAVLFVYVLVRGPPVQSRRADGRDCGYRQHRFPVKQRGARCNGRPVSHGDDP
jgi:hypothetical protein